MVHWRRNTHVKGNVGHLIAAGAPRPDALAVVPSAKQLLIGPEVNQVHQTLTTLRAHEAVGMPQVAMVTCALGINSRSLLGKLTVATATALEKRGEIAQVCVNTPPHTHSHTP